MKQYKISEKHLTPLPHITKRNPHDRLGNTVMSLYAEAAIEAKALKLHGGPVGHEELYFTLSIGLDTASTDSLTPLLVFHSLKKRAETAIKAAATRVKNGTVQRRGSHKSYQGPRIRGYHYGYRGYETGYW